MISRLTEILVSVLRPALGAQACSVPEGITASEWRELYALAARHNVQGLMHDSVQSASRDLVRDLPLDVAAGLVSDSINIASDHKKHLSLARKMAAKWADSGIEAVMVKGLETAKYYPRPEARVLGDIDWWIVHPEDWTPALGLVRSLGCKINRDSDGDVNFQVGGIVVELHRKGLKAQGGQGELCLLAEHLLHHAVVFGCELRHIIDYSVARNYLGYGVKDLSLERWYRILDNLSDYIICGSALSADAERLLEMTVRGASAFERTGYFLRVAPRAYFRRIVGLCVGRIKRFFFYIADCFVSFVVRRG